MSKENIKLKKGFTIIETVLVLAIAGLIMALVFLALPALQTGQRDQARKQDVNNISVALASYLASNNATYPGLNAATPPANSPYSSGSAGSNGTGVDTSRWTTSGVAHSAQTKDTDGKGQVSIMTVNLASNATNETKAESINPNSGWVWIVKGTLCPTDAGAQSDTIQLIKRTGSTTLVDVPVSRYSTLIELEGGNKAIYCVNN